MKIKYINYTSFLIYFYMKRVDRWSRRRQKCEETNFSIDR